MALRWALCTDTGLARERNEDCAAARPERGLFAIADGMGGHVGGEVASQLAIQSVLGALEPLEAPDLEALGRAVRQANQAILEEASRRRLWGMGTTLTLAHVGAGAVQLAHVGDSRAYLLREGRSALLTTDQTVVEMMVRQGFLPRARARHHPERHVLAQALGTDPQVHPELSVHALPPGARLLLSTDGIHDQIHELELVELASAADLTQAAEALVRAANRAGGLDNATVILVET